MSYDPPASIPFGTVSRIGSETPEQWSDRTGIPLVRIDKDEVTGEIKYRGYGWYDPFDAE